MGRDDAGGEGTKVSRVRAVLDAEAEVEETASWKCRTCPRPSEGEDKPYCLSCRIYWEDVENGLFDRED